MKLKLLSCLVFSLFLSSCTGETQENVSTAESISKPVPLEIYDKGFDSIFLDETADFQRLAGLKLTEIDHKEYLSYYYYLTRTIYIHDLESGELVNKVALAREGPNKIDLSILVNYFIHRPDSIFIDTYSSAYYLINDKGEVIKKIGNYSGSTFDKEAVSLASGAYFKDGQIHGSVRMPFNGTPKETIFARASIKFQSTLEVIKSVKNEAFIDGFEEIMAYRKVTEKSRKRLDNMPRHLVNGGNHLYATTPLSDSIRVFEEGRLVDSFYAGVPGFDMATYQEYVNFKQSRHKPGEITQTHETRRKAYHANTLIDPEGKFIYRVFVQGTHPVFNENVQKELPEITAASLLVVNVKTMEAATFDLPIDEILIGTFQFPVFVSKKGIYFRVKDQENEDQVQFRVFGLG